MMHYAVRSHHHPWKKYMYFQKKCNHPLKIFISHPLLPPHTFNDWFWQFDHSPPPGVVNKGR